MSPPYLPQPLPTPSYIHHTCHHPSGCGLVLLQSANADSVKRLLKARAGLDTFEVLNQTSGKHTKLEAVTERMGFDMITAVLREHRADLPPMPIIYDDDEKSMGAVKAWLDGTGHYD